MPEGRRYTDDEVEAILRRAIEQQVEAGDRLGHDELIAAAREVGLDPAAVERVIEEISSEISTESVRASLRRRRRERWVRHLVAFLAVLAAAAGLHTLGLVGLWVFWIVIAWGVLFTLDTYSKLRRPTDEEVEREQSRLNRKARRRARAIERHEARRRRKMERTVREQRPTQRSEASVELERVIEEGVSLLLRAAANRLRTAKDGLDRKKPDTEFSRYVARRKAGEAQRNPEAIVTPPPREPARVRVEPDATEEAELELGRKSSRRTSRPR